MSRHVNRVADVKEDELEKLYEERSRKLSLQQPPNSNNLEIDPVDVLPVKTLDGQLYYRTGILIKSAIIIISLCHICLIKNPFLKLQPRQNLKKQKTRKTQK